MYNNKPKLAYCICYRNDVGEIDYCPGTFRIYNFKLAVKLAKTFIKVKQKYAWVKTDLEFWNTSKRYCKANNKWCKKIIKELEGRNRV